MMSTRLPLMVVQWMYSTSHVNPATTDFRDQVEGMKVMRSFQPRIQPS
jgi:hypothetical protein